MTLVKFFGVKEAIVAKESYYTLKKRLLTSDLFMELTVDKIKITVNKSSIESITQKPKKIKVNKLKTN